jgi:hypothetical protein
LPCWRPHTRTRHIRHTQTHARTGQTMAWFIPNNLPLKHDMDETIFTGASTPRRRQRAGPSRSSSGTPSPCAHARRSQGTGLGSGSPCARNSCCSHRLRRTRHHERHRRGTCCLHTSNAPPTQPWSAAASHRHRAWPPTRPQHPPPQRPAAGRRVRLGSWR